MTMRLFDSDRARGAAILINADSARMWTMKRTCQVVIVNFLSKFIN